VSIPMQTIARFVSVPMLVYSCYLILTGVSSPGGAFGGGVVVGIAASLSLAAEEKERVQFDHERLHAIRLVGFGGIVLASAASVFLAGGFLGSANLGGGGLFSNPFFVVLGFGVGALVGGEMVIVAAELLEERMR